MANRSPQPGATWRSDPRCDFPARQLLALARGLLNSVFDDAVNIGYGMWLASKPRRRSKDARLLLAERDDDPEHGVVRLLA